VATSPFASEASPRGTVELSLGVLRAVATLRTRAHPDRIVVARQFVAGAGDAFGIEGSATEDSKLAVTEACTNSVMHAYEAAPGPLQVEARLAPGKLLLVVRDHGRGGVAGESPETDDPRFGIELIHAVADEVEIVSTANAGTEVRMGFALQPGDGPEGMRPSHAPLVRRIVSVLAAEAGFTLDRLADAVLVGETVVLHGGRHAAGELLGVGIAESGSGLELRVGPLGAGGGAAILHDAELPAVGSLVERLVDGIDVRRSSRTTESLILQVEPRR
jgi:anti-sigma regulatory factor (Ser/Thr protein kinase)